MCTLQATFLIAAACARRGIPDLAGSGPEYGHVNASEARACIFRSRKEISVHQTQSPGLVIPPRTSSSQTEPFLTPWAVTILVLSVLLKQLLDLPEASGRSKYIPRS